MAVATLDPSARPAKPLIAAVLTPQERSQVDAAVHGYASFIHRDTIAAAMQVVRERPIAALLVSVQRCRTEPLDALGTGLRGYPAVPAVAFVSQRDPGAVEMLLRLGASGVKQVVDVTTPQGWARLRETVGKPPTPAVSRVQGPILESLPELPPDAQLFLEAMLRLAPTTPSVRQFSSKLGVASGTLLTRFARAELPSPKNYLAGMRLLYAAELLEAPGRSIAEMTIRLDYSSPQSFGRHLRTLLGITPSEFRQRLPFPAALSRFIQQMLVPYRTQWKTFHPLHPPGRGRH